MDALQRTNRTFGLLSIQRPKIPGLLECRLAAAGHVHRAHLREDRDIVEMEQAAHDAQGGDWNQEVFPVIRDLRRLLAERGAETIGT